MFLADASELQKCAMSQSPWSVVLEQEAMPEAGGGGREAGGGRNPLFVVMAQLQLEKLVDCAPLPEACQSWLAPPGTLDKYS
jgi:hypothetical protein